MRPAERSSDALDKGLVIPMRGWRPIAVGRTRATLQAPLWRWVGVAMLGLVVGWVLLWLLSHLIGALDGPWWLRLELLLGAVLGGLAAWRVRLGQIEQANRQTLAR